MLSAQVSALAHLLSVQTAVGSTIQADGHVFGLASFVSMTQHKDAPFVRACREFVVSNCPEGDRADVERYLDSSTFNVGWMMNERIVNIPQQLAPPLHAMLLDDVKWARENPEECGHDVETFDFQYALVMSPAVTQAADSSSKKKRDSVLYVRPEEEELLSHATVSFDFSPSSGGAGHEIVRIALVPWEDYVGCVEKWRASLQ